VRQLDSARRLHDASQALGAERARLLVWALVDDLPWTEIGKRLRLSTKTATCRAVEAIAALALWCADLPVPPPPVNRPRVEPGRW
jgi:DNA-directed RNA polymerase specialized sigma24 family protein